MNYEFSIQEVGEHSQRCSTLACEHICGACHKFIQSGTAFVPFQGGVQLCAVCVHELKQDKQNSVIIRRIGIRRGA